MDIRSALEALPGKAGKENRFLPLWMHLTDTVAVMSYLCEKRVPPAVIRASGLNRELFRKVAIFLAEIHDMGKCTPAFCSRILISIPDRLEILRHDGIKVPAQDKFKTERNIMHAMAGEILLHSFGCPDGICSVVGAHHGSPSNEYDKTYEYEDYLNAYPLVFYAEQKELWHEMQKYILHEALTASGFKSVEELPALSNGAQVLLCGLLIQADWIASNEDYFPLLTEDDGEHATEYPERFQTAINRIGLTDIWRAEVPEKDETQFFFDRFGFPPNPVQSTVVSVAQKSSGAGGLLIIEAQMGAGKTEAALAATEILAEKNGSGGLFFGLPTQATSNGLFPRLTQWASCISRNSAHAVRLVHGMAELNEDYRAFFRKESSIGEDGEHSNSLTVHSWFSGRKQALLADFVVGTVDNALMAALRQKHVMLQHLGLCGKVVVIDECHAYDAYMSRFLCRLLQWLGAYHVPVILLSATLPEEKKRQMIQAYCVPDKGLNKKRLSFPASEGYPLITLASDPEKIQTIAVQKTSESTIVKVTALEENALYDALSERLAEGGCAGIIVNTVKRAQTLAEKLRMQFPNKKVYVYHAQFVAQERIRREKELMEMLGKHSVPKQRDNVIVVGTQVLEQSLDIDFDFMITDLCPMDLLLQRMGRLHRHQRLRPAPVSTPQCAILGVSEENNKGSIRIYGEWLLKQTKRYLPESIVLPDDIPGLVNSVYAVPDDQNDSAWLAFDDRTKIQEDKASDWCLKQPKIKLSKYEVNNSIVGLLDSFIDSDRKAEASVRDGISSVDVLVMCDYGEDHIGFLPWISDTVFRRDAVPSNEEARQVLLQRLRLPFIFGTGKNLDEVIEMLERENSTLLSQWQESSWLKGELILLLSKNGDRELCGYRLHYDKEYGLQYERTGD